MVYGVRLEVSPMNSHGLKVFLVNFCGIIVRRPTSRSVLCISIEEDAANAINVPVHFSVRASGVSGKVSTEQRWVNIRTWNSKTLRY